ncbi:MAG: zinc finger domain protein [Paenibacillus sp.]|nr:zinc finger domain protein [Paenibacillus sp.]
MAAMVLFDKNSGALEKELKANMGSVVIKRGWSYYKEGRVRNAKDTTDDILTGIVQGGDLYAVVIDTEQIRYSTCTCPVSKYCKHMAAVYFYYMAHQQSPEAAEASYFRLLGLAPASSLVKTDQGRGEVRPEWPGAGDPGPDGTAAEWFVWMDTEYGETFLKCRHSLHALQPVLSALKGLSKDWEKPQQRLHWLSSIIFVLEQAERAIMTVDSFSRYYHEMSFLRMAEPWLEHGFELLSELDPVGMGEQEWAFAVEIAERSKRRATQTERQLFEWPMLYLSFCEVLARRREWFDSELTALLEAADRQDPEQDHSFLHAAAGMFYFLDGDDAASIARFKLSAFEKTQKLVYPCVAQRMEAGKWEAAEAWMSYLFEKVHAARNARNIGPFMTLCRRADEDRPESPVWTTYMTELLPYSYADLSEHWLNVKRYEDWADLQMLVGAKSEDLDAAGLREVARLSPESLLPLYHQSIEANIATRNRQGYRIAVKAIKKLEKLYKSMKQADKWEAYLAGLNLKYQRLRALQEELWKGKVGL